MFQYQDKFRILLFSLMIAGVALTGRAQTFSFFRGEGKDEERKGKVPTVITSDSMDLDIGRNICIFTGNVRVEDEEMHITCHKMIIHLEEVKKAGKNQEKPAGPGFEGTKRVSRIICLRDVVIIRKLNDPDKKDEEQKALCGKADYDVKTGKIIMTEEPILMRTPDSLRGEVITIWRDSQKVRVEGGSKLELKSDSIKEKEKKKDKKK